MEQASVKDILNEAIRHLKCARDLMLKLDEQYGIGIVNIAIMGHGKARPDIHLRRGIDEAAEALGETATTENSFGRCSRKFKHNGTDFVQLAEEQAPHFLRAFEKRKKPEVT